MGGHVFRVYTDTQLGYLWIIIIGGLHTSVPTVINSLESECETDNTPLNRNLLQGSYHQCKIPCTTMTSFSSSSSFVISAACKIVGDQHSSSECNVAAQYDMCYSLDYPPSNWFYWRFALKMGWEGMGKWAADHNHHFLCTHLLLWIGSWVEQD